MRTLIKLPRKNITKKAATSSDGNIMPNYAFKALDDLRVVRLADTKSGIKAHTQFLRCDLEVFCSVARRPLTPLEEDWLRVILFLYGADRLAPRKPYRADNYRFWKRSIRISIPVTSPTIWQQHRDELTKALELLTGDCWHLDFRQGEIRRDQALFFTPKNENLGTPLLFSGGLDSLAGAIDLLNSSEEDLHLISGSTHNQLLNAQRHLVGDLNRSFNGRVNHTACEFGFAGEQDRTRQGKESTQRCRGMFHVGMGLFVSHLSKKQSLVICENGIGAFNLSASPLQRPGQCSHSVHPVFLKRISAVFSKILSVDMVIKQPALFETKGQLCKRVFASSESQQLIDHSFSCEMFPNYRSKKNQCGRCSSCLVRRASLYAVAFPDAGEIYQHDFVNQGLPSKGALRSGHEMLSDYCQRVQSSLALSQAGAHLPWEYPEIASIQEELADHLQLPNDRVLKRLSELNHSFVLEWTAFVNHLTAA